MPDWLTGHPAKVVLNERVSSNLTGVEKREGGGKISFCKRREGEKERKDQKKLLKVQDRFAREKISVGTQADGWVEEIGGLVNTIINK